MALAELGWTALGQDDQGEATACYTESLMLLREGGIRGFGMERALCGLGWVALLQDKSSEAAPLFAQSLTCYAEATNDHFLADCVEGVAIITALRGQAVADSADAARLFGAAEAIRAVVGGLERARDDVMKAPYAPGCYKRLSVCTILPAASTST